MYDLNKHSFYPSFVILRPYVRIHDSELCVESHGGSLLDLHRMVHQRGPQQVDRRIAEDPCHVQRYRMQQDGDGPALPLPPPPEIAEDEILRRGHLRVLRGQKDDA